MTATSLVGCGAGCGCSAGGMRARFENDPELAVELARLAAAERTCCEFFTFGLDMGPAGMWFTATAPAQARGMLDSLLAEVERA